MMNLITIGSIWRKCSTSQNLLMRATQNTNPAEFICSPTRMCSYKEFRRHNFFSKQSSSMNCPRKSRRRLWMWSFPATLNAPWCNQCSFHTFSMQSSRKRQRLSTRWDQCDHIQGICCQVYQKRVLKFLACRDYGITEGRKNMLMSTRLLNHCERIHGPTVAADRKTISDAFFVAPFEKDGDKVQLELTAETFMSSRKPISPVNMKTTPEQQVLPVIFPLKQTVSIPKVHFFKEQSAYRKFVSSQSYSVA